MGDCVLSLDWSWSCPAGTFAKQSLTWLIHQRHSIISNKCLAYKCACCYLLNKCVCCHNSKYLPNTVCLRWNEAECPSSHWFRFHSQTQKWLWPWLMPLSDSALITALSSQTHPKACQHEDPVGETAVGLNGWHRWLFTLFSFTNHSLLFICKRKVLRDSSPEGHGNGRTGQVWWITFQAYGEVCEYV